jgi:hypothetical protein
MDSSGDTPKGWVAPFGYPRINACSRLPVALRSVPRPSSPPGAKASTECPSRARDAMRRNHPQKQSSVVSRQFSVVRDNRTGHRQPIPWMIPHGSLSLIATGSAQWRAHLLSPLNVGSAASGPGTYPLTTGQTCNRTRPETHQNLINPDKEPPPRGGNNGAAPCGNSAESRTSLRYLVEVIGLEPTTPCLQSRCSPS